MARVPAILRPLGGPLATYPERSETAGRFVASAPAPPLGHRLRQWLAAGSIALAAYSLIALIIAAAPGMAAVDPGEVVIAAVNSLVLSGIGAAFALTIAGTLSLAAVAGPAELRPVANRAISLAAATPPIVVAFAAWLAIGRPEDVALAVLAVFGVQGLVLGPCVATHLIIASSQVNVAADEAARDLGASGWARFRTVVWPSLAAAGPGIVGSALLWSLSDVVTPVLLAGPLPTLPSLIWRHAVAGDSAIAAAVAVVLLALSGLASFVGSGALPSSAGQRSVLELPAGWSSLVLTVSVAVLFPLVMAPLVLVTAAGGDLAPLLSVWPPALGGALIGALCAVIATLGIRGITRSQSWLGRILQAAPAPVLAVGTVVAFGAMAGAFELGPLLLISVIGTVIGLQSAARHAPSVPPLSLAARDAARDLGANPATASVPIPARSVSVGVLTVAAETVGAGAFAFVVIAGLSHPLVIALSTELMSQRPTAAAAALSILAVVAVLRGIAAWTARQSNLGEEL